jgi:hypothetical protein
MTLPSPTEKYWVRIVCEITSYLDHDVSYNNFELCFDMLAKIHAITATSGHNFINCIGY